MSNYWSATHDYLERNGGHSPTCPACDKEMTPEDDHGRFICLFCPCAENVTPRIPQVSTEGMTNAEKAKIPPINRLHSPGTAAEQKVMRLAAKGPDCMDNPEYRKAVEELEKERAGET